MPETVSIKRLLDISWSTNAFASPDHQPLQTDDHFRQHIPSVRIHKGQSITTAAACEASDYENNAICPATAFAHDLP